MNLYPADATTFTSQGLGQMDDGILDGVATVEINGVNEIEFTYSVNGRRFPDLETQMIVTAENQDSGDLQPYRIYKISKPLNGRVRINAQHLIYDLIGFPVVPFTATGITPALSGLSSHCLISSDFSAESVDYSNTTSVYNQTEVKTFMNCLMGSKGSILDTFGNGLEFEFDGFKVKAYSHLGTNKGVKIHYGKNMTALKAVEDATSLYTAAIAFWKDTEGHCVYGSISYCSNYEAFPIQKVYTYDASADYQEQPTTDELTARAAKYVTDNNFGVPKITIEASFVNLADSPEFDYLKNLTRVKRGDIVTVIHEEYRVVYEAEVIKTQWDLCKKRYKSITIGAKKGSISSTLKQSVVSALEPQVTAIESQLSRAIREGTERIRGGLGGYVVINTNADGQPNEILIMDTPSIATATNIIRLNNAGIGFSSDGYDGEYRTAWTIDGEFYADFITAGTLHGALLEADSVQTASLNVDAQDVVNGYIENIYTDTDGLHITKVDPDTKAVTGTYQALFSDQGMRVIENDTDTATLIAEGDSVTANNLTAQNFLIIDAEDYKARFQKFSNTEDSDQMGCFWIG